MFDLRSPFPMRVHQILVGMQIGTHNVYVLGPRERPVNVFAQQCRALNLAWALDHIHTNNERKTLTVAIVGGGAAGVTAAASLARSGFSVTLIERATALLPHFSHSIRFLHPRLYDWPDVTFNLTDSALPLMNWRSGLASDVANSLLRQFDGWRQACDIEVLLNTNAASAPGKARVLRLSAPSGPTDRSFDIVILAPGFGPERLPKVRAPGWISQPWWELSQDYLESLKAKALGFVGVGDGSLSDLFESVGVLQAELVSPELIHALGDPQLLSAAATIETWIAVQRLRRGFDSDLSVELEKEYRALVSEHGSKLVTLLRDRVSRNRIAGAVRTLYAPKQSPFDPGAYPLNRLLLACLRDTDVTIQYRVGRYDAASGTLHPPAAEGTVVLRPGPIWRFEDDEPDFADLIEKTAPLLNDRARIGFLRTPAWSGSLSHVVGRSSSLPPHAKSMRLFSTFYNPEPQMKASQRLSPRDFERLYLGHLRRDTLLFGGVILTDAQVLDGAFFRKHLDKMATLRPRLAVRADKKLSEIRDTFVRGANGNGRRMRFWSLPETVSVLIEKGLPGLTSTSTASVEDALHALVTNDADVELLLEDWRQMDAALETWERVPLRSRYERRDHLSDLGALCAALRTDDALTLVRDIWRAPESETRNTFEVRLGALPQEDQHRIRTWMYHGYDAALAERHEAYVFNTIWVTSAHDRLVSMGHRELAIDCLSLGSLDAKQYARVVDELSSVCGNWRLGAGSWQEVWRAWTALNVPRVATDRVNGADDWARRCAEWIAHGTEWECWVAPPTADFNPTSPRVSIRELADRRPISITTMAAALWPAQ